MQYLKINQDGSVIYPLSILELKKEHPNTSFPKKIPEDGMPDFGVYQVAEHSAPEYDVRSQKIAKQPPMLEDGAWVVRSVVVNKTQDEINNYDALIADKNRMLRNRLLSQTDYFALTDVTMNAAMTSYRQALRDITTHANWPHLNDEDWPTKPE